LKVTTATSRGQSIADDGVNVGLTVYFLRHGETTDSWPGAYGGEIDAEQNDFE
jgi:hypothetical protein